MKSCDKGRSGVEAIRTETKKYHIFGNLMNQSSNFRKKEEKAQGLYGLGKEDHTPF